MRWTPTELRAEAHMLVYNALDGHMPPPLPERRHSYRPGDVLRYERFEYIHVPDKPTDPLGRISSWQLCVVLAVWSTNIRVLDMDNETRVFHIGGYSDVRLELVERSTWYEDGAE